MKQILQKDEGVKNRINKNSFLLANLLDVQQSLKKILKKSSKSH